MSLESVLADKKGGHIGEKFLGLYGGFFADVDFISELIKVYIDNVWFDNRKVLELWANNWVISSALKNRIPNNNYIIADLNYEALVENNDIDNKVTCDNKNLSFDNNSIDVVIMRSVLHYEKTDSDIIKVLGEIRRVLKDGWVLIDESAVTVSDEDKLFLASLHKLVGKNMTMNTPSHLLELYRKSWFKIDKFTPSNFRLKSYLTDFLNRYKCYEDTRQNAIVIINQYNNSPIVHIDWDKSFWDINYSIFVAKK